METNIDDCSGEMLGFVMEQLLAKGALDVFFTSIFMKKNRPAYRLTVVCNEEKMELLQKVIIRNLRNCKKVYYQNLSPYGK